MLINLQDVVDGALANSLSAMAAMLVRPRASRRTGAELDLAAWMDTDALVGNELPGAWLELPEMSDEDAAELEAALKRHEVQGALQALLAARLTDAPEEDAAWAREVLAARLAAREAVRLALSGSEAPGARRVDRRAQPSGVADTLPPSWFDRATQRGSVAEPASSRYAEQLSEYFDDKISALVASLEARVGFAGLAQVRAEAYNARIVALLGAIERQVAALADPGRGGEAETEWLARYRRQAHVRHGFLYPPDFDRRRRVPVADIYVPTEIVPGERQPIIEEMLRRQLEAEATLWASDEHRELAQPTPQEHVPPLNVLDLATLIDRTVLLGDPGGGKTTAANVLADFLASDDALRVPFLVTLREYAEKTPVEWSVAEHIEHNLKAFYQSPPPGGLVERLLLTGRAVVIFDGLDELLDTSRRRDVSERVEQFCSAYPLTPVLVTSRVVGYDQARLDDAQFTGYRLGGFGDDEVADYARKWFATQDGMPPVEAEAKAQAFLAESAHATDLRANPLLLSLMCILYRGAGSLPTDQVGIYARCAELLLRKWDGQRDLYRKVRADHLVEPAIRYLAWWLFTRDDPRATALERDLVTQATGFLHERGFESKDEASAAAREFIEFCRGRMWVFSDAGTTVDGEKLYAFTHRTFLEYFAAGHLAAISDTPEDLARELARRLRASGGWEIVGELAVKVKSDLADRGTDRVYVTMLDELAINPATDPEGILLFLVKCLASARPSPGTARRLTGAALDRTLSSSYQAGMSGGPFDVRLTQGTIEQLFNSGKDCRLTVADELSNRIAAMVASDDESIRINALQLIAEMAESPFSGFANEWAHDQLARYAREIIVQSTHDTLLRRVALGVGAITIEQVLALPGGCDTLANDFRMRFYPSGQLPYLLVITEELLGAEADVNELAALGRYVIDHPILPWARANPVNIVITRLENAPVSFGLDELSGLGAAAAFAICTELYNLERKDLSELPMPTDFKQLFRDWTEGRVDFVEILEEESS